MGTDWKDLAVTANFRCNIYGLLASVFREEPSESFIQELKDPHMVGVFQNLGIETEGIFGDTKKSEIVEALSVEFARLFIGPENHISAHESIFNEACDGMPGLWGDKTIEVKSFIETTGLRYNEEFNGVPDHISVELEFMQKLIQLEAERWDAHDQTGAEDSRYIQQKFLDEHLLNWAPRFCNEVIIRAEIPIYRLMAEMMNNYLEFDQQILVTDNAA